MKFTRHHKRLCLPPLIVGVALLFALPFLKPLVQFEHTLFWFPKQQSKQNSLVERMPPEDFEITVWNVSTQPDDQSRLFIIEESPEVTDWLFTLNAIRTQGAQRVAISPLLSWPESSELELRALEHEIASFEGSALGLDLRLDSVAQPFPGYLKDSVIPKAQGNLLNLPEVNAVVTSPSTTQGLFGFRALQSAQPELYTKTIQLPLLARWGNKILPSLELASLINKAGCTPKDLTISLGHQLRIGDKGPVIPIDSSGNITLLRPAAPRAGESISVLIHPENQASPQDVLFITHDDPPHLRQLATTLSMLGSRLPRDPVIFKRLPLWGEFLVLIFLTLLLYLRPISALILLPLPLILAHTTQQWLVLTPALGLLLVFLLLKRVLKNSPAEEPSPPPQKPSTAKKEAPKKSSSKKRKKRRRKK